MRVANERDHLRNAGLIGDRTKWALIDASAAGNAFVLIDHGFLRFRVNMNRFGLAGVYAGPRMLDNGGVRSDCHAAATFHAFGFIDYGAVIHNGDSTFGAIVHAAVR